MISTPQFEREKMVIVLDHLAETLTAVSSNFSGNRDEVAFV